jgi:hypothetical protein
MRKPQGRKDRVPGMNVDILPRDFVNGVGVAVVSSRDKAGAGARVLILDNHDDFDETLCSGMDLDSGMSFDKATFGADFLVKGDLATASSMLLAMWPESR